MLINILDNMNRLFGAKKAEAKPEPPKKEEEKPDP